MGETIHPGVIDALHAAADAFLEEEEKKAEFHREQQFCYREIPGTKSPVLSIDALLKGGMTEEEAWAKNEQERARQYSNHGRIVEDIERRSAEVMAFCDCLFEQEINGGAGLDMAGLDALLTANVRGWLRKGFRKIGDFEKWAKWERNKELARQEQRVMDRGFIQPDEQFAMYKAALLLRGIPDCAAADRADEPNRATATAAVDGAATDRDKGPGKGDGAADGLAPLLDVLQAVQQHELGHRWPKSITGAKGEIQERLFKVAGSTDRAIVLFCELYQCREHEKALDSAVKRQIKTESDRKKGSV